MIIENGPMRASPARKKEIIWIVAFLDNKKNRIKQMEKIIDNLSTLGLSIFSANKEPNIGPTPQPKAKAERKKPTMIIGTPRSFKTIGVKLNKFIQTIVIERLKMNNGIEEIRTC
jgi:hypothetical protein